MSRPPTRSAFTLIELLIAVSVFTTVAIFATSILANAIRVQVQRRQSQDGQAQASRTLAEIGDELRRSTTAQVLELDAVTGSLTPQDDLLVVTAPLLDGQGRTGATMVQHVYCARPQQTNGPKLLVRYTIPTTNSLDSTVSPRQCTDTAVPAMFHLGGSLTPDYLNEPSLEMITWQVWPIWQSGQAVPPDYDQNPPAVGLELTGRFDASVTAESRASDSSQTPYQFVLSSQTNRNQPYTYGP